MKHALRGILAVVFVAGIMWIGWKQYKDFLNQGQKPTKSTQILNKLVENGLPDFELKDIKGRDVNLAKFSDKVIVLNFWASWCGPCVEEFPSLINLIDHYKGEVVLLAISADTEEVEMLNFIKAFGVKNENVYIMWDKEQSVAKKFGTFVLPESYIVARKNKFVRKVAGVDDWSSAQALNFFKEIVEGPERETYHK